MLIFTAMVAAASPVLRLHPENPRYFEWRGAPVILIGSGEHYGALVNLDFDFGKYLATLHRDGLNITRTFSGAGYVEPQHAFSIERNTLAPKPGRFLAPWGRSDQPGAWDGGSKWDLGRFNEDYFHRLRALVAEASSRGVVVEFTFFCPFYPDAADPKSSPMWPLSPWNPANNVNGLNQVAFDKVHTLHDHGGLLEVQERFVRRVVAELKEADNLIYEICNEPYFGGVTLDWQHHIAHIIADAQSDHPNRKLISQNIANKSAKIENPSRHVSLFNFHYAYPPTAVAENRALRLPIGDNETGFRGQADEVYRNEAWDFLMAGGALFNHLDYSFAAGAEDGSFDYPDAQPGGGSAAGRAQLAALKRFVEGFDFVRWGPVPAVVDRGVASGSVRMQGEPGKAYAAYIHRSLAPSWADAARLNHGRFEDTIRFDAPAGEYDVLWMIPADGREAGGSRIVHPGGALLLRSPVYESDLALRVRRR